MKNLWKKWCEVGLHLPYAHDPVTKKPSVTLLFPYITFVVALVSVIAVHFSPTLVLATYTSLFFWGMSVVFYMLRKLSKAKFDLDDKSFELDGSRDD